VYASHLWKEADVMLVTLDEAKAYLRVDSTDEDFLISQLIQTAESLVMDILRMDVAELGESQTVPRTAEYYAIAYLYEHREEADYKNLMETLKNLLFAIRREVF
jgi:uncharacterized phage protein (predicted DNA packaging)